MRRLGIIALLCLTGCQSTGSKIEVPLHYDIGNIHREVTTASREAQMWFDRGLGLAYGFNHEEAIVCFEQAVEADPDCAICYWGKAYALGPNYNAVDMTAEQSQAAYEAVQLAVEKAEHANEAEQALIRALAARYSWPAP